MKIGLIVFSQTGNTLKVAQALESALKDAGHEASIQRVTVASDDPKSAQNPVLTSVPDPGEFDMVYFASPVQAFSLAQAMQTYLKQMPALNGKWVACFVTQQFPYGWMGGNHALRQFRAGLEAKGARFTQSGAIHWGRKDRDQQIARLMNDMVAASPVNL